MKKQLLLLVVLILPLIASADAVEINGIYYNLYTDFNVAEVTSNPNKYTGSIVIPESVNYNNVTYSVMSIGNEAFDNCSDLTSITIGSSVTSIGNQAFDGCSKLTSIKIPNSVTSIGDAAFNECFGLYSIKVEAGNAIYDSRDNCNAIIETASNTLLYGCKNTRILSSVTSIGDRAFYFCRGLTSVIIPNSVKSIGESAFNCCFGLKTITIGNSVTSIGDNAFFYCYNLTSVIIPNSVKSIGKNAFAKCSKLNAVTIGNSVTSIGSFAFDGCTGLKSVTIGNSVTTIGSYAFSNCSNLTSITIPNSVKSIGYHAFEGCTFLKSVIISSGVTSLGYNSFDGVDIPIIISLIENPFGIYGKGSSKRVFTFDTFDYATLYVPNGTIDKYKATEGWMNFVHIEEGNPTGINDVENAQNSNTTIYDMNGVHLPETRKGINIVNGKKVIVK